MKKIKPYWIALLAAGLCAALSGCDDVEVREPGGESTQDIQISQDGQDAQTENLPGETPPETVKPSPETEAAKEPVAIETVGGAVIVGQIAFDDQGWYIIPEQPLNISYEYFLGKPSVFPEQSAIRLIDPKDDGMDKAVYLGQTVTVQGEFRFVRNDFETLYLLPYTVTLGKTVEASYGDPSLRPPEEPADRYDRSRPLPKYMEPLLQGGRYVYNAFMLSEETLQLMGNDFAVFYCDFVDAFLNGRSSVPCPDRSYAELLGSVIYYDFPLFDALAQPFEFFRHYDGEAGTVSIVYKYGEDEHKAQLDRFLAAADALLESVEPGMSEVEKAKAIYHALCTRMEYDNSALVDFERKNSHFAYLNNSGVCLTFANVYNQLLTQVGIPSTLASCEYDATMGHIWSMVTLNGERYFCDPTFELSYDNGSGYRFFGLNYADRTRDGLGLDGIRAGRYCFSYTVLPEMLAERSLVH